MKKGKRRQYMEERSLEESKEDEGDRREGEKTGR
jgi:hypothetical protein